MRDLESSKTIKRTNYYFDSVIECKTEQRTKLHHDGNSTTYKILANDLITWPIDSTLSISSWIISVQYLMARYATKYFKWLTLKISLLIFLFETNKKKNKNALYYSKNTWYKIVSYNLPNRSLFSDFILISWLWFEAIQIVAHFFLTVVSSYWAKSRQNDFCISLSAGDATADIERNRQWRNGIGCLAISSKCFWANHTSKNLKSSLSRKS